jgi:hypothetical protein
MPFVTGVLTAAAAAATAGCASAGTTAGHTAAISRATSPGSSQANPASPPPASSPPSPPDSPGRAFACGAPPVPAAGDHFLTLTSAQDGKTYCVTLGTNVLVLLKGTPGNKWGLIRAAGSALRPSASGHMTLMIGVTGASFLAVRPGSSVISSTRPVCPSSATPADVPCDAVGAFHVTVLVRAGDGGAGPAGGTTTPPGVVPRPATPGSGNSRVRPLGRPSAGQ